MSNISLETDNGRLHLSISAVGFLNLCLHTALRIQKYQQDSHEKVSQLHYSNTDTFCL